MDVGRWWPTATCGGENNQLSGRSALYSLHSPSQGQSVKCLHLKPCVIQQALCISRVLTGAKCWNPSDSHKNYSARHGLAKVPVKAVKSSRSTRLANREVPECSANPVATRYFPVDPSRRNTTKLPRARRISVAGSGKVVPELSVSNETGSITSNG